MNEAVTLGIRDVQGPLNLPSPPTSTSNKYEQKTTRLWQFIWGSACLVAGVALAISVTIAVTTASAATATAALVHAIVLSVLLAAKLLEKITPYLPCPLRRLVYLVTGIASELIFIPFSSLLFLTVKSAANDERLLKKAIETRRAALATGNPPPLALSTRPILLVHGYCFNSAGWHYIAKALKAEGYGVYTIDLGSVLQSIPAYAERVKKRVEMITEAHGCREITLIGHSMGGVVNTYYQHYLAPSGTVRDNILCGSPARGSFGAYLAIGLSLGLSKSAWNMRPGSTFMRELNRKVGESAHRSIFCLRSNADLIVFPNRYQMFKGQPKEQQKLFEGMGHLQFLYSGKVIDTLLARLRENHVG